MSFAKFLAAAGAAAAMATLTATAQAALFDRGGGMIYDSTRNITWLADMNYPLTVGINRNDDGRMNWIDAMSWAENLTFGGYSDWRLPTLIPEHLDPTCDLFGYNCTGGELSGLFVIDLGNKEAQSFLNQNGDTPVQIANLALFRNVRDYVYWSSTGYAPNPGYSLRFLTYDGKQTIDSTGSRNYVVAVRPGDVAPIPEPETYALMLLGIGYLGLAVRRRTR